MEKKKSLTNEQVQDSIRLRALFAKHAGMSQLEFGQTYGIGNQGMVWQYLNADKPKGSALNIAAAIKFAEGLHCRISDFSPSIQREIDRIAQFATKADTNEKQERTREPQNPPSRRNLVDRYNAASETTRAAIDLMLLPQKERISLKTSILLAITTLEEGANEAFKERKKDTA